MKKTKIYSNMLILSAAMLIAGSVSSCSDWNDHYDANTAETATSTATIWENINSNTDLSEFADLLKRAGYDKVLNTTQVYTVWAPLNGTYDYAELAATDSATLLREFVKNHVTRYNYPASGSIKENIYLLNNKLQNFVGDNTYTFGGVNVRTPNLASSNGVIHTIEGKVNFFSNLYEYLNKRKYAIDSISDYVHKFDVKILDTENSVVGPTVNGEITYLDSVFLESNALYSRLNRAYINREDSNFSMILPTNKAWNDASARLAPYFNYIPTFKFSDYSSGTLSTIAVKVANGYLKDSLMHYSLVKDLIFNNNLYSNKALINKTPGSGLSADSLVTTTYDILYKNDAEDLFQGTEKITMSNGFGWVTDSMRVKSWNSWCKPIKIEAEYSSYCITTLLGSSNALPAPAASKNPEVSGSVSNNYYIDVVPSKSSSNPEVYFKIPNILSTSYDVYCVFLPANITNVNAENNRPYKVKITIGYNSETGATKTWNNDKTYITTLGKVDTVNVGTIQFPIAYRGMPNYYPFIKVKSNVVSSELSSYSREMRIDCILLVPKELNDYKTAHPGYTFKYDTDY
ncbi:MAG: fasciclin domain-containing protein [Bacteroidaceae bacterium]|nr:fasciclin domain-containing protein [Bacteroidaceae bacterium]